MHECSKTGEFESIKQQNADQFKRLSRLEEAMSALKTDIIGVSGNNGLRGEFRQFQKSSLEQMEKIAVKLESMDEKRDSARRWQWEQLLVAVGLVIAAASIFIQGAL